MNIERMQREAKEIETVHAMIDLAGVGRETALASLSAASEKEYDFAFSARVSALANLWSGVSPEYQHPDFAKAILRAANRHASAKWWIACEPKFSVAHKGTFVELDSDIEKEMQ